MRKPILCTLLAAALCVSALAANAAFPEAAPPLNASSEAALTLQDFAYFPDFSSHTDEACEQEFRFPGPEVVKRNFGTPDSVDEAFGEPGSVDELVGYVQMYYPFGWVLLFHGEEAYRQIEVLIDTDALEGPRGLRVGDSVEMLLTAFHNEDAGLPMISDEEGLISLYQVDTNDGAIYQYAYAVYLGDEYQGNRYLGERLVTIEYGMVNAKQQRCTVSFEVGGGTISHIYWRISSY